MKIVLGAKEKLGFINGEIKKPTEEKELKQWRKVDYMVQSWILGAILKDMNDAFLYVSSAKHLWDILHIRYGETNGVLIFNLKKEISSTMQGNRSVTEYLTELQKLWDELRSLRPLPAWSCEALEKLTEHQDTDDLVQFLMGLNNEYEAVKDQILLLDPLPNVSKAYSMVLKVERQKKKNQQNDIFENSIMLSKEDYQRSYSGKADIYEGKRVDKSKLSCEYCRAKGHTKDTCFKLHGYP